MSKIDPHIEAYLDRAMDAQAMEQFSRRIADDPELARAFINAVRFDIAMRNQYRGEVEVDDLMMVQGPDGLAGLDDDMDRDGWLEDLNALEDAAGGPRLVDATDLVREREDREKQELRRQAAMLARHRDQWGDASAEGRTSRALLAVAAAVVLFVGGACWFTIGRTPPAGPPVVDGTPPASDPGAGDPGADDPGAGGADRGQLWDTGVVLTMRSTPTWGESPDAQALPEDTLTAGTYRLAEGVAELVYPGGAVVTVLAPAEIELSRRNGLSVVNGKVLCEIPDNSEVFLVDTGAQRFASRGARLGLHVADDQVASYMFAGSAEYRHGREQVQLGQADRLLARTDQPVLVQTDVARPNDLPGDYAGFEAFAEGHVRVAETFDEAGVLDRFVVRQGYLVNGSTPGRVQVRSGRLELQPGGNNTVCCYMSQERQTIPAGSRWVIDLIDLPAVRSDDQYAVFLCLSSAPTQPGPADAQLPARNGAVGFRLRYDVGKRYLRIEADGAAPAANAEYDLQVSGTVARLAIGRLSESRFAFWVMCQGDDQWHLIGEQVHPGLAPEAPLFVGVEVFSWYRGRTFGFDNLRLEETQDLTHNGQRRP